MVTLYLLHNGSMSNSVWQAEQDIVMHSETELEEPIVRQN